VTNTSSELRAVLDSSVLVPYWSRVALRNIAAAPEHLYVPVWSEWIVAETWRVLTYKWLAEGSRGIAARDEMPLRQAANAMLRYFVPVMELVTLRGYAGSAPWPALSDPDDAPVWQTAVLGGARCVVSHNTRHFPPLVGGRHAYQGVEYLTAIEFIEELLGDEAAAGFTGAVPMAGQVRSRRSRRR
jgi:hypothetical protein